MRTAKRRQNVAVVIPCYNEAAGIQKVIRDFKQTAQKRPNIRLTVYVVDNNSSDNTAAVAKKAGAKVLYEPIKGKGNALRAGFRNIPADTDYVVMMDGDNTYSPEEMLRVIEPLESNFCDVVVGSRLGGRIQKASMKRINRFGNKWFTFGVRLLYGANLSDVLSGYFAWKKSALDALGPHITSPGFAVEMEMITKMAHLGLELTSVPISYHPRAGQSNLRPVRDGLRILKMLLKNLLWRPKPAALPRTMPTAPLGFTPRKLVFVSDTIYPYMKGGKEKRLHEITKRLAAMGHEVHIYTMHWWAEPNKTRIEEGVQLHALCKYHPLYQGDRRAIAEGVLFGLACFKLFRVRFDVLDVDHMPFFPIFSTWVVCVLRRKKLYATWHEALTKREWISYMGPSGIIAALIERLSIKLPHYITAASAHTREALATHHRRVARVELVASGIDTSLLNNVSSAAVDCDILFVGRLVKDKHVDQLIEAVDQVVQTRPHIRCLIIGAGPESAPLKRLVKRHKLSKNVVFLGALAEASEVYAYMKAAKVFCSPSVREGFGITVLEALACGTPVITADSPANAARHLVHDGQNGSIVTLQTGALASAILHWVNAPKRADIAAPLAQYDWHQLAKKQVEVYSL